MQEILNPIALEKQKKIKKIKKIFKPILTLCMLGNFACFFVVCGFFFKINFFKKNLTGIPSECQIVWIQIRPEIFLLDLIWVQTVCKGYQQTTKLPPAGKELNDHPKGVQLCDNY